MKQRLKYPRVAAIITTMLITGCASHARKVDCDSILVPINTPAPKSTGTVPKPTKPLTPALLGEDPHSRAETPR